MKKKVCVLSLPCSQPGLVRAVRVATRGWLSTNQIHSVKITANAPENKPGPKRKVIFQPFSRAKLLVLGRLFFGRDNSASFQLSYLLKLTNSEFFTWKYGTAPKGNESSSNHEFSGAVAVSGSVNSCSRCGWHEEKNPPFWSCFFLGRGKKHMFFVSERVPTFGGFAIGNFHQFSSSWIKFAPWIPMVL